MLRCTLRRLGHQLIKEPLGNEMTTAARADTGYKMMIAELWKLLVPAGIGLVGTVYALGTAHTAKFTRVKPNGKIVIE